MPIYEYKCISCSHVMEKILPYSESHSPQKCNACGSQANKILSASNIGTGHAGPEKPEPSNPQGEASGITIHNSKFEGCDVGISAPKGAKLNLKGNEFINVKKPLEYRDK